jgi:nucleotide-binding universal stress UspA family protein
MFHRLLVPLDGSALAEQALSWALAIAGRSRGCIELVRGHVLYALRDPATSWCPFDAAEEARWRQEEQSYLDDVIKRLAATESVQVSATLVNAAATDAISGHIQSSKADLVVMATHGRGPFSRFFLGSVANELIRRAAVPLLLIGARETVAELLPEPIVAKVLVPLDGSALAEQALPPALDLARLMGASCSLLRVVSLSGETREQTQAAHAYLERLSRQLHNQPVPTDILSVAAEHVWEAILEAAEPHDVIALATHGRSGVERLLLGSVADKVIRGSWNPVLVYRPKL